MIKDIPHQRCNIKVFVNLKSNPVLLSNESHNLLKCVFPSNNPRYSLFNQLGFMLYKLYSGDLIYVTNNRHFAFVYLLWNQATVYTENGTRTVYIQTEGLKPYHISSKIPLLTSVNCLLPIYLCCKENITSPPPPLIILPPNEWPNIPLHFSSV